MTSRALSFTAGLLLAVSGTAFAGTTAGSFADRSESSGRSPLDVPASLIISHAGMEWVWAAPCASEAPSCGAPTPAFGFDNPTMDQWATWSDRAALIAAFTNPSGGPICASAYFGSGYSHCDMSDAVNGHIWHAFPNGICDPSYYDGCVASTTETFYVRAVPEPETYALMIAGLGVVGFMARRRQQRSA